MNSIIALHQSAREYIYPVDRKRLRVRIKCSREGVRSCKITYWNRFNEAIKECSELKYAGRDNEWVYFDCELSFEETARYIKYYFIIHDGTDTYYLGRDGLSLKVPKYCFEYLYTNERDILTVPEWAKGSVLYQIFPDRFFNQDKNNDPQNVVPWHNKPTRENFFGGDLKGIIAKLDHLN